MLGQSISSTQAGIINAISKTPIQIRSTLTVRARAWIRIEGSVISVDGFQGDPATAFWKEEITPDIFHLKSMLYKDLYIC